MRPLNECGECGLDFGGVAAFDRHRTGRHDYRASRDRPDGRRCRVVEEFEQVGLVMGARGRWVLPHSTGRRGRTPQ